MRIFPQGAGELQFSDEDVIEGLLTLITDDHSHKVKAAAIEGEFLKRKGEASNTLPL